MSSEQPFSLFEVSVPVPPAGNTAGQITSPMNSTSVSSQSQSQSNLMQSGSSNQGVRTGANTGGGGGGGGARGLSASGSSFSGSTSYLANAQANLIVNYIPVEVTEPEFHQLFEQFGEVESARIVTDRTTGYSKGYGFVRYTSSASAQEAMNNLDGFAMYNKRLKVGLASRQAQQQQQAASVSSDNVAGSRLYVKDTTSPMTGSRDVSMSTPPTSMMSSLQGMPPLGGSTSSLGSSPSRTQATLAQPLATVSGAPVNMVTGYTIAPQGVMLPQQQGVHPLPYPQQQPQPQPMAVQMQPMAYAPVATCTTAVPQMMALPHPHPPPTQQVVYVAAQQPPQPSASAASFTQQ